MPFGHVDKRELPPNDNVARYCRKRDTDENGIPMDGAFLLREDKHECYLSTNWLEYFHPSDRTVQIHSVIQSLRAKGRTVANSASFAVLNVRAVIAACKSRLNLDLRFVTTDDPCDPSHTGIYGYVEHNARTAAELAKLVDSDEVYPVAG